METKKYYIDVRVANGCGYTWYRYTYNSYKDMQSYIEFVELDNCLDNNGKPGLIMIEVMRFVYPSGKTYSVKYDLTKQRKFLDRV